MKKLSIVAAVLFASTLAMAEAPNDTAPLTREQVKAELLRARAAGELDTMYRESAGVYPAGTFGPTVKSRAQVRVELKQAVASGELETQRSAGVDAARQVLGKPVKKDPVVAGTIDTAY